MFIYESEHGLGEEVNFTDVRFDPPIVSSGVIQEVTFWLGDRPYSYKVLCNGALVYIENSQIVSGQ